jgi:hypothetical protein
MQRFRKICATVSPANAAAGIAGVPCAVDSSTSDRISSEVVFVYKGIKQKTHQLDELPAVG